MILFVHFVCLKLYSLALFQSCSRSKQISTANPKERLSLLIMLIKAFKLVTISGRGCKPLNALDSFNNHSEWFFSSLHIWRFRRICCTTCCLVLSSLEFTLIWIDSCVFTRMKASFWVIINCSSLQKASTSLELIIYKSAIYNNLIK